MAHSTSPSQYLLPTSLKLRNLQSISLRNLRLASSSNPSTSTSSSTSTTADDDALPQTLHSPAKLLALNEEHTINHARSHSDLRGHVEKEAGKSRPQVRRLRRRSTIDWANATPQTRQRKWEAAMGERMGDVFFSLHMGGIEEPVYVSEMVEQTMNPTFGSIDWAGCGAGILRGEEVLVQVWGKGKEGWALVVTTEVDLRRLVYVGKNLANMTRSLPSNALLFHLPDGVYTTPSSPFAPIPPRRTRPAPSARNIKCTSTFDALLRLQKLTDTIQDALETRNKIAQDLEHLLLSNKQSLEEQDDLSETNDRLKTIEYAKSTVSKQLAKVRAQQAEKRASLAKRRELMASSLASRKTLLKEMTDTKPTFPSLRDQHQKCIGEIQSQRRRICEDLQVCYPITSTPNKPLAFRIRGLQFPHTEELDSLPPEEVAAALGHVAHVLQLLSFYFRHPLPYPITPRGSTSTIYDGISLLSTSAHSKTKGGDVRTYPLFSKSVPRFRFEYAVFLLGWNLKVFLEEGWGVRVEDPREVLGNLKLGFVLGTEGEGEVVGRKVGGIRGLGRRRGSRESVRSAGSAGGRVGNGRVKGARERLREISRVDGVVV